MGQWSVGRNRPKPNALLGALILFAVAGCAALEPTEPPRVSLADIRLLGGGLFEQQLQVDLRIGNPNNFDLPLEGLSFELEINERPFAQGYSNRSVTVPRLGEAQVPVVATTTLFDMFQQTLALGQRTDITYRLVGKAYVKGRLGGAVPYERSGRLRLIPDPGRGADTLVPL